MCAGPFSQELLGISDYVDENGNKISLNVAFENALLDKQEVQSYPDIVM
jgi:hypothetical protein